MVGRVQHLVDLVERRVRLGQHLVLLLARVGDRLVTGIWADTQGFAVLHFGAPAHHDVELRVGRQQVELGRLQQVGQQRTLGLGVAFELDRRRVLGLVLVLLIGLAVFELVQHLLNVLHTLLARRPHGVDDLDARVARHALEVRIVPQRFQVRVDARLHQPLGRLVGPQVRHRLQTVHGLGAARLDVRLSTREVVQDLLTARVLFQALLEQLGSVGPFLLLQQLDGIVAQLVRSLAFCVLRFGRVVLLALGLARRRRRAALARLLADPARRQLDAQAHEAIAGDARRRVVAIVVQPAHALFDRGLVATRQLVQARVGAERVGTREQLFGVGLLGRAHGLDARIAHRVPALDGKCRGGGQGRDRGKREDGNNAAKKAARSDSNEHR